MSIQDLILNVPIQYLQYLEWHKHAEQVSQRAEQVQEGQSFAPLVPRFEFKKHDELVLAPGARARAISNKTLVESDHGEAILDVSHGEVARVFEAVASRSVVSDIDDELAERAPTHAEPRSQVSVPATTIRRIVNSLAGIAILAPRAVQDLESAISGASIVRFPVSPYYIVRNYWSNMGAVQAEFERSLVAGNRPTGDMLRRLHLTAIMGPNLDCFYKPHSLASDYAVWPGHFRTQSTTVSFQGQRWAFYLGLVAQSLGVSPKVWRQSHWVEGGLDWGRSQARGFEGQPLQLFVPPPVPTSDHIGALLSLIDRSGTGSTAPLSLEALAAFHQRFVRLHPFECGNQSIVQNMINVLLKKWHGVFVPHLELDFLALFLPSDAYAACFARAVKHFGISSDMSGSCYELSRERLRRSWHLVSLLTSASSPEAAGALIAKHPEEARYLLLCD